MSQFVDLFPDLVRVYGNSGEKEGTHAAGLVFFVSKKKAATLGLARGAYYQLLRTETGSFRLQPVEVELHPLKNGHLPQGTFDHLPTLIHCKNNGATPQSDAGYRIYVPRRTAQHYRLRPGHIFQVVRAGAHVELLPVEFVVRVRGGPSGPSSIKLGGRSGGPATTQEA